MTDELDTTAIVADAERVLTDAWHKRTAQERKAARTRRLEAEVALLDERERQRADQQQHYNIATLWLAGLGVVCMALLKMAGWV